LSELRGGAAVGETKDPDENALHHRRFHPGLSSLPPGRAMPGAQLARDVASSTIFSAFSAFLGGLCAIPSWEQMTSERYASVS
jgi:hypothetical protein